jgi:hypothetical protein
MARPFGPTPGRPYISGPPRPIHPPPRIPRDSGPADVPDGPPRGPGEKLFGGQYTRAEVIQRYKRFGGPNEAIAAYKRRLDRQRKGIYLGQSSGTSSGQGSGSASGRGGTSVGSGPIVPVQRPPRFGGPKNGKPNLGRSTIRRPPKGLASLR